MTLWRFGQTGWMGRPGVKNLKDAFRVSQVVTTIIHYRPCPNLISFPLIYIALPPAASSLPRTTLPSRSTLPMSMSLAVLPVPPRPTSSLDSFVDSPSLMTPLTVSAPRTATSRSTAIMLTGVQVYESFLLVSGLPNFMDINSLTK